MKHIAILFFLSLLIAGSASSQNANDAVRYAYLQPGGTARFLGAGGALGALGADFSTLSQNPAGLALFRTDELSLTPSLRFSHVDATLSGNDKYGEDKSKFGFDNVGLVFNTTPKSKHWKTFNFGIGYNRQADYNRSVYYEGNAEGSIMNGFFAGFKAGASDPFGADLANDADAFYIDSLGNLSYDFAGNENANVSRAHVLNTFGRMNEMAISFAGNYDEKLMVGVTIGVPFANYRVEGEYTEEDLNEAVQFFDRLSYTEYLRTSGVGVNLKLGVIYKISQALRLGAAFHTPTALRLTDSYSNTFTYEYTGSDGNPYAATAESPDGTFDYRLRTPWRAIGSAALVIKKLGFLSAEVELVDYAASRFNFTADVATQDNKEYERQVNNEIQRGYKQAANFRFGAEAVLDDFRLRGGFNLLGQPQEGEDDYNTAISVGAGYRGESFFLDLGWRLTKAKGAVAAYQDAPLVSTQTKASDFLLTLGFKF